MEGKGGEFKERLRVQMVAWWKARGGSLNKELDVRWLHGGRQGGNISIKT